MAWRKLRYIREAVEKCQNLFIFGPKNVLCDLIFCFLITSSNQECRNVVSIIQPLSFRKCLSLLEYIVEIDLCRCGELSPRAVTDGFRQRAISSHVLRQLHTRGDNVRVVLW